MAVKGYCRDGDFGLHVRSSGIIGAAALLSGLLPVGVLAVSSGVRGVFDGGRFLADAEHVRDDLAEPLQADGALADHPQRHGVASTMVDGSASAPLDGRARLRGTPPRLCKLAAASAAVCAAA